MDRDFEEALMLDDAVDENEVNEGIFKLKELFNAVNAMVLSIIAIPDDELQCSSQPPQCSSEPPQCSSEQPPSTKMDSAPTKMETSEDHDEGKSANEPEPEKLAEEDKINKPF